MPSLESLMMPTAPAPQDAPPPSKPIVPQPNGGRGRWKIGAALLALACLAQSVLWALWWEDPTHFKMSVLFVWPAAVFALLNWWTFRSGWSWRVRLGVLGAGCAAVVVFFNLFQLDRFDGDMVPTRIVPAWRPSADQAARDFIASLPATTPVPVTTNGSEPVAAPLVASQGDWPGYRGMDRMGVVREATLRTDWSVRPPKELWKHPVGKAWSSFAVIGDMAFTQEQRGDSEAVVAYSLTTGQQVWSHLDPVKWSASDAQGGTGPRATPQFDSGLLYTQGATGLLSCLDAATGRGVWSADILKDAGTPGSPVPNLGWGTAGSPLVVDQFVIVVPGGKDEKSVVAYDKQTGQRVWSGGSRIASYGSPRVETLLGERTVLVPLGDGLAGHALDDGRELWFFKWGNGPQVNGAQPLLVADNSLLFGCGYGVGTVRLDLSREKSIWTVTQRWHSNRFRPKFNDFVLHNGHVFGLDDGTLTCLDIETGKVKWKSGRYGYGQILLVGETLLILSEDGRVILRRAATSVSEELASFQALDPNGITWNHPVLVRGKLLVRNAIEAACFELE